MTNLRFLLLGISLLVMSCAKVYYSPESAAMADQHRIIAVAPPTVSIVAKKDVDKEALQEQQRTESRNFQNEMVSWLLRRKQQNKIHVNILDLETTNVKLTRAGYFDGTLLTPGELCDLLEVDGIITSNYALTKPMSEGAALAIGVLVGVWGTTNETTVTMGLHDRASNTQIWNYNQTVSGSVGSSPARLVDNLMQQASRRMPYTKK
ncbi:MAG: hypothetical protein K9I85_09260 [Saprospiraceae bacterium]|nr:hypothetical protein [Saprospiraceae bacterium]